MDKLLKEVLDYLDTATPEQLEEDWKELEPYSHIGPCVEDLIPVIRLDEEDFNETPFNELNKGDYVYMTDTDKYDLKRRQIDNIIYHEYGCDITIGDNTYYTDGNSSQYVYCKNPLKEVIIAMSEKLALFLFYMTI